jgi:CHAT domain-containing protein
MFRVSITPALKVILLVCFVVLPVSSQTLSRLDDFVKAEIAFNNGDFVKAIQLAGNHLIKAKALKNNPAILSGLEIRAYSQIVLKKLDEAEVTVQEALSILTDDQTALNQKANIYFCASWLKRQQRNVPEAFDYAKKALSVNPDSPRIRAEFYLNIGRILFSIGYDISAVIWLEKAESLLVKEKTIGPALIETYRFLMHAWISKANFNSALAYSEKLVRSISKTKYPYKYRQALFERGTLVSASGQKARAYVAFHEGLQQSLKEKDSFYSREYLTTIILNLLYNNDSKSAAKYLPQLEKLDIDGEYSFEIKLIKGIIYAFDGKTAESDTIFRELENNNKSSDYILPSWKTIIAEKNGQWGKVIVLNQELSQLAEKSQSREELPQINLSFAKAYFHLGESDKAAEHLEKSIALIEEIRQSGDNNLSLGLFEIYHHAYRLLSQVKVKSSPTEAFQIAEVMKARLLKDKISDSFLKRSIIIPISTRNKLEELSSKYIEDQSVSEEIEKIEKLITNNTQKLDLEKPDFSELNKISELENSAIVSYFFSLDKKLLAFVWEKGKIVRTVELSISEDELERLANKTHQNIKDRVFFKRDGKAIYDKLLKPLSLTSNHLIIAPDKSLWKIPFQALSSDGEKYLIEEKLISYAPSISILLEQIKGAKPNRQTLQAFANTSFENRMLRYVNAEASAVSGIYGSKPLIDAAAGDFTKRSERADILHFSMHAEVDNEEPLDSYLGFKKIGNDDGRLTVEEILKIKLKKGSLVFLASCDTNNVFSGEGLVSLAWGMMGSGATTVIYAGWEANDKSTAIFTKTFYENYKRGSSSAEAIQKAALELIRNKSNNMHEPYYWADFSLNGDFR